MLETVTSCWHDVFHFDGVAFDHKDFLSLLRFGKIAFFLEGFHRH
jgi:hypothetical protein